MDKPIYNGFLEFLKATFNKTPEQIPAEQLKQLKMAFFGGAVVTENLIGDEIIAGTKDSINQVLWRVQNELVEYGQDLNIENNG